MTETYTQAEADALAAEIRRERKRASAAEEMVRTLTHEGHTLRRLLIDVAVDGVIEVHRAAYERYTGDHSFGPEGEGAEAEAEASKEGT